MSNDLRNFLSLSYEELEELNLKAKKQRLDRVPAHDIQEERIKYLTDEKRIKAVTVLFSDLEGRLHMLDYDKKFLIKSWDNLTFDGSSIRGFTAQRESDLRLGIDWSAFYWGPADIFGNGKVLVFGEVIDKDGSAYRADIRGALKSFATELFNEEGYTLNAASNALAGATSTAFTLRAIGAAAKVGFISQPSNANSGANISVSDTSAKSALRREYRRLLSFPARGSVAHVHRHDRGSPACDGLPKRKRSSGSRAITV